VVAGGVFNSGLLADPRGPATFDYKPPSDEIRARALGLDELCRRQGADLGAAALQFPLRHPAVVAVLAGVRSVAELAGSPPGGPVVAEGEFTIALEKPA